MPHLSPMLWVISPLMFIFILFTLLSSMWWIHYPYFPNIHSTKSMKQNNWNWD